MVAASASASNNHHPTNHHPHNPQRQAFVHAGFDIGHGRVEGGDIGLVLVLVETGRQRLVFGAGQDDQLLAGGRGDVLRVKGTSHL